MGRYIVLIFGGDVDWLDGKWRVRSYNIYYLDESRLRDTLLTFSALISAKILLLI